MEQVHANDNDDPFISLAAATARLFEKTKPDTEHQGAEHHRQGERDQRKAERTKFKIG